MTTPTTTAPVKQLTPQEKQIALMEAKAQETQKMIEGMKGEIIKALPKFLDGERMMRIIFTTLRKNPKLYQAEKNSLINAILTSAQLGLECDGVLGQATILPYTNNSKGGIIEAQFQVMYKGLVDLLYRTGLVSNIHTGVVYENEFKDEKYWQYEKGFDTKLRHRPLPPHERGEVKVGAYCVVLLKDGTKHAIFMWGSDILKRRDASPGWKSAKQWKKTDQSPWTQWEEGMWEKTAVKEACKLLKLSSEDAAKAIAAEDEKEYDDDPGRTGVIDVDVSAPPPQIPGTGTAAFDEQLDKQPPAGNHIEKTTAEPPAGKPAEPPKTTPPKKTTPAAKKDQTDNDRVSPEEAEKTRSMARGIILNYQMPDMEVLGMLTSPQGVPISVADFKEGNFSIQDARRFNHVMSTFIAKKETELKEASNNEHAATEVSDPTRIPRLPDNQYLKLAQTVTKLQNEFGVPVDETLSKFGSYKGVALTEEEFVGGFMDPVHAVLFQSAMDMFIKEELAKIEAGLDKSSAAASDDMPEEERKIRDLYIYKELKPKSAECGSLVGDMLPIFYGNPAYMEIIKPICGSDPMRVSSWIASSFIEVWHRCDGNFKVALDGITVKTENAIQPGKLF